MAAAAPGRGCGVPRPAGDARLARGCGGSRGEPRLARWRLVAVAALYLAARPAGRLGSATSTNLERRLGEARDLDERAAPAARRARCPPPDRDLRRRLAEARPAGVRAPGGDRSSRARAPRRDRRRRAAQPLPAEPPHPDGAAAGAAASRTSWQARIDAAAAGHAVPAGGVRAVPGGRRGAALAAAGRRPPTSTSPVLAARLAPLLFERDGGWYGLAAADRRAQAPGLRQRRRSQRWATPLSPTSTSRPRPRQMVAVLYATRPWRWLGARRRPAAGARRCWHCASPGLVLRVAAPIACAVLIDARPCSIFWRSASPCSTSPPCC